MANKPKKLIIKALLSKEDEDTQIVEGDEPIHEKWISKMRYKLISIKREGDEKIHG